MVPAPAGMSRIGSFLLQILDSGPRTCGDEPNQRIILVVSLVWSPHLRG